MPTKPLARIALLCLVVLIAAIFIGGAQPGAGSLFPPPWDKVVHVVVYGTMGLFAALAFPRLPLPVALLLVLCIGGADEIHQIFLPGRHPGLDDWMADLTGLVLASPLIAKARTVFSAALE